MEFLHFLFILTFISKKNLPKDIRFIKINASSLVALVEPGTFQTDKLQTENIIKKTLDSIIAQNPDIDVMTLSSTHLPFLKEYLEKLYSQITFLDPAETVAQEIYQYLKSKDTLNDSNGSLSIITTIDQKKGLTAEGLRLILSKLGLQTEVKTVYIK